MQTMIALLKRECQEHLFGFAWSPVAVLGLIIVVMSLGLVIAGSNTATITISSDTRNSEHHNHEQFEITDSLSSVSRFINFGVWSDEQLSTNLKGFRLSIAMPFQYLYVLIAIFVLLGALHDDRRDRSVLFWKSMPVTDAQTVLSKLIAVVSI